LLSALVLLSRIGDLARFPNPRSLANYFGLTPTCKNSGEQTNRIGGISKEGSALVRFVLGLMVTQVVRHDAWMRSFYRRIKKRRGAKIARVAVMRRLCTVIYRMLETNQPYIVGGPGEVQKHREFAKMMKSSPQQREQKSLTAAVTSSE
jgi:transposase